MRALWRNERWVFAVMILCAGAFLLPVYYAARLT
jgi:hypothetical protein